MITIQTSGAQRFLVILYSYNQGVYGSKKGTIHCRLCSRSRT